MEAISRSPRYLPLLRSVLPVAIATGFAGSLLVARVVVARERAYEFLVWNLFLAWVPLGCAVVAEGLRRSGRRRARHLLPPLALWLLFLPNAPYLITDLVHVRPPHDARFWCNLATVFAFAFAGLMAGIASMRLVRATLAAVAGPWVAHLAIVGSAILCGVGIYVGRVLRWNSWDLLTQPHVLLPRLGQAVLDPWSYRYPATVALVFGALFAVMYLAAELSVHRPARDMMRE